MKVLIADDSLEVLFQLVQMIREISGVEIVGVALDGAQATNLAEQVFPDVLVLDYRMPKLTGLDVLKAIKQQRPATVVMILTNYGDSPYRTRCLAAGADFFFDKSKEFEKVAATLMQITEKANASKLQ